MELLLSPLILIIIVAMFLYSAVKILKEYERGVIFMLGRFWKVKGPGLILLMPGVQKMVKVSLRTLVLDVPTQDIITKDNVSVKVSAVVYFRVLDARQAIIEVEDYLYATSQLSQTTLRSVLGQADLDELLSARDKLNQDLQRILDRHTEPWGVKISNVEIKNVDLPQEMQRAMAKEAARPSGRHHHAASRGTSAPYPPDDGGNLGRKELDHYLPAQFMTTVQDALAMLKKDSESK